MFETDKQLCEFMLGALASFMWRGTILNIAEANQAVEYELAVLTKPR